MHLRRERRRERERERERELQMKEKQWKGILFVNSSYKIIFHALQLSIHK